MLTVEETAMLMGVGSDYVYRLTSGKAPKIGFYKPNGKLKYFLKADLLQYMQQNRTMGASEIETKAKNYLKRER
jgi:excisionase family DNA binding protein